MAGIELLNTPLFGLSTLKAYYRMEGNANDSKNSHNGTASNVTYDTSYGRFLQGATFASASPSKITISDHADFRPTGSFTIGGWFKRASSEAGHTIISSSTFTDDNTVMGGIFIGISSANVLRIFSAKNTGNVANTDYKIVATATTVADTNWHLGVGTWDQTNLKIYLDNEAAVSEAWASAPAYRALNAVGVGVRSTAESLGLNNEYMNGYLDDVFFYNGYAWTAQDVLNYYNGTWGGSFILNFV